MKEFCRAEGKGAHYPIDQAGVWVDCFHQRRPVIHNDYASLPHRKGLPKGHAPVVRELVVPILRGDRVVAILGVGNKPTDYTERDVEVVRYLADVAWEIAERKQAEEALRESEEKFRNIFENAVDGIMTVDRANYSIAMVNERMARMLGYSVDELLKMRVPDLHPAEVLDEIRSAFERNVPGQLIHVDAVPFKRKDGTLFYASISSRETVIGGKSYMLGIFHDITERKQTERKQKLVGDILDALNRRLEAHELISQILHLIREFGEFDAVAIRLRDGRDFPYYVTNGFTTEFVKAESSLCGAASLGRTRSPTRAETARDAGADRSFHEPVQSGSPHRPDAGPEPAPRVVDKPGMGIVGENGARATGASGGSPHRPDAGPPGSPFDEQANLRDPPLECTCGLILEGRADPNHPLFSPGGSFCCNDMPSLLDLAPQDDPRKNPRNRCIHDGYQSMALIPLHSGDEVIGLLQLNDKRPSRFTRETIVFFEEIGASIGIALKRMQGERALRETEKAAEEAGVLQQWILQDQVDLARDRLQVYFHPRHQAGGDFVNVFPLDEDRLLVVIGDVSGHNLPAAFLTAYFQGAIRVMLKEGRGLTEILDYINQVICRDWNRSTRAPVLSLDAGLILLDSRESQALVLANGLPPPVCTRSDGAVVRRHEGSSPLGWFPERNTSEFRFKLEERGVMHVWTDGLEDFANHARIAPCAVAYRLARTDQAERRRLLQDTYDDVLGAVIFQKPGMEDLPRWHPLIFERHAGDRMTDIDALQARWERSLVFALGDVIVGQLDTILIAMREIVLNALKHGCQGDPKRFSTVEAAYQPQGGSANPDAEPATTGASAGSPHRPDAGPEPAPRVVDKPGMGIVGENGAQATGASVGSPHRPDAGNSAHHAGCKGLLRVRVGNPGAPFDLEAAYAFHESDACPMGVRRFGLVLVKHFAERVATSEEDGLFFVTMDFELK
jgi:PAS domain S-box-containing protein